DGIRDDLVTGVQTCALPILSGSELRDYFVFDLTSASQTILSAQLNLFNPANGYNSPDATETYTSFDVSTAISSLEASGFDTTIRSEERRVGKECRDGSEMSV